MLTSDVLFNAACQAVLHMFMPICACAKVRMLGIIHRLTAMQEQLLRSSAASRLMHWFERGSDFSALAEELRKKRDGVLAAFQAKISADHFSANGPVNYETSVNAPPSTPRPTMAQAALAAAAIEHATPSVLSDADMDAAATGTRHVTAVNKCTLQL